MEHIPLRYGSPLLPTVDTFQDTQWMPETTDSAEPYRYYVFPTHAYLG